MSNSFDISEILKIIPHRYPFVLIDKILSISDEGSVTAIKNVSFNEPFFQGHFPDKPVMPGVLILESMAQAGAAGFLSREDNKGKLAFFAGVNNVKFRKMVVPGDVLELKCNLVKARTNFGKAKCVAKVNGEVACEAEILFAINS